jgi:hypothetical protein
MTKSYRFTHFIDDDNFRLTPEEKKVEVECTVTDNVCTVTRIHMTSDLLRCVRSFTELSNDIELGSDALFCEPETYQVDRKMALVTEMC